MRPPMLRNSQDRSMVVGESTTVTTGDSGGFWKGVVVGAGGLILIGATVSLVRTSLAYGRYLDGEE